MFAIIALIIFAVVALAILGFAAHVLFALFSPLFLLLAVGVVAWLLLRTRRSHQ